MPSCPFSETVAHPGDPLPAHLERVAGRAAASVALPAWPEVRRIAFLAGLFHDIGKATPYFQEYLLVTQRRTELTPHAKSGAVIAWWYTAEAGLPLWQRLAVFIAVLRHHGALDFEVWHQPLDRVRDREDEDPLHWQLRSMDLDGIRTWLRAVARRHDMALGLVPEPGPLDVAGLFAVLDDCAAAGRRALRRAFGGLGPALAFEAGFGAMLAVDKLDAALRGAAVQRPDLPADAVKRYLEARPPEASPLDARRTVICETVERTWLSAGDAALATLTAPTGSGKTLTVLNAALAARAATAGHSPRLIYCLPFTSVIDQNHEVFRCVLGQVGLAGREDLLLKHHHLTEGAYRTADTEHEPDGAGQLLTESWQSEIVVTTFHQLLHTLLSKRNADLKRAGQLTGALVLMDEVQAIPLRYWQALRHLFLEASAALGTRFVLLTATRPLIFRPGDALELLPDHDEHFRAMSRVELHCHHRQPLGLESFGEHLGRALAASGGPALVVVNRRRAVRELYQRLREALPGRPIAALSTDLTPRDRRARIRLLRRWLDRGVPCVVVSTQLIEAGVDLSFPQVHRDLAPLDSIVQSAGRCNRHGRGAGQGEVHLWALHETRAGGGLGAPLWSRVYDASLIDATVAVLGERDLIPESELLALSQAYFEQCWGRQDQEPVDEWLASGAFECIARKFRLIDDGPPRRSLYVIRTPADRALWERYAALTPESVPSPLDRERSFRRFRHAFYERVIQVYGRPDPERPIEPIEVDPDTYSRETGFRGQTKEDPACIF